jgi:predicted ATPase
MITQIEIDGFKTFLDFKVELAPFQVIVGANASGKSNLFDALHLLSRLAEVDLRTAFQELRGDADEQFTLLPTGQRSDHIRIAVEMLVDRKVQDELGQKAQLTYTRLRYEIAVAFKADTYGLERPYVLHESLKSIPQTKDHWSKRYGLSSENGWLPAHSQEQKVFIDTQPTTGDLLESVSPRMKSETEYLMIYLYPDSSGQENIKRFYADEVQRTVLSRTGEVDYSHIFAAREELRSLKFLHLNPEALREPSPVKAPTFLSPEGRNLPAMLARMQTEDKFALTGVSLDMTNLVPGIIKVKVVKDKPTDKYLIWVEIDDKRTFSAEVLSDGTLRLLALAAVRNDPQLHGILCLEEPENGVHPLRLKKLADLLREMATDFTDFQQVDEPLRQVLVTTHSPMFISQADILDVLLFAYTVTHVEPRKMALEITCMTPVVAPDTLPSHLTDASENRSAEAYTLNQVIQYLNSDSQDEARAQLEKARTSL